MCFRHLLICLMTILSELTELMMSQAQQLQQQPNATLLYTTTGEPVAISLPGQTSDYELYKSKQSKIAGAILITNGVLSIVLNGIGIGLREIGTFPGHGFWCGIMVSISCIFYILTFISGLKNK